MPVSESVPSPASPVVLVVDDDAGIASLLEDVLLPLGCAVEHAADGPTGLARIRAGGIDLVLLDLALPALSGLELCRAVRAAAPADEVYLPIIMITGFAGAADRRAGFAAGADDYVPKPFDLQELCARVAVWLRVRRHAWEAHAIREALREVEQRQAQAQIDAIHLTARELADRLNNDLALAVGFLDLLQLRAVDLTAAEQSLLADAQGGLAQAVHTVGQLHHVVRIATKATPTGPALDLDRSTASGSPSTAS